MAETEGNRALIKEAGGIQPITKVFVDAWGASSDLQEVACKCLLNLSISPGIHVVLSLFFTDVESL